MRKRWMILSWALGLGCGLPPADSLDAGAYELEAPGPAAPSAAVLSFEAEVLAQINHRRAQGGECGAQTFGATIALKMNDSLRTSARLHSEDQARNRYFSHDSLDGRTFRERIRAAGYLGGAPWGENIAAGQASPSAVVSSWMGSPGHCANILSPAFRGVGIGYASQTGSPFTHYWTQDFGGAP
jgi:uncharacterized protein YkwD